MNEQVVDLTERRQQRLIADSMHPALRWVAGATFYIAHRKEGQVAACGAAGELMLAPPGVPLCVDCYPLADRAYLPGRVQADRA